MSDNPKIALVHDELVRRGGAEIVLEELLRIFPDADVYALYASNTSRIDINDRSYPIHTSYLQRLPRWFRKHPGRLLPLLPQAAEQLDLSGYDLVITSSSGFAKGVVTRSTIPHTCYCHTPTRYLWDTTHEVVERRSKLLRGPLKLLLHYLRVSDFAASQRPSAYVANSIYTQRRISAYYRRDSEVIYPPVDTTFFSPGTGKANKEYFLVVARLSPTKYIDHAIQVCEKLHLPLRIVGSGSERSRLKRQADTYTTFEGAVTKERLRDLYRGARAYLQPGIEDFGIASVEALSCGTPVIAFGEGGIQEIAQHGKHGVLYNEHVPEALAEAIRQFDEWEERFHPEHLQQQAMRFGTHQFRTQIEQHVHSVLKLHK